MAVTVIFVGIAFVVTVVGGGVSIAVVDIVVVVVDIVYDCSSSGSVKDFGTE